MPQKKHPKYATLNEYGMPVPWGLPLAPSEPREPKDDGVDLKVFRAEIDRREAALMDARYAVERKLGLTKATRKAWKPMVTYKAVKGGGFKSLISQKQHDAIHAATHPFAFTAEQVRKEMSKS